jgi:hypothetical protein
MTKEESYQPPIKGRNETRLPSHDIKYLNENINSIMHLCVYGCGYVDTYVVNHLLHGIVYVVYNNYFQKSFSVQKEPFFHNYDNDIDSEIFPYLSEIPEENEHKSEQEHKRVKID